MRRVAALGVGAVSLATGGAVAPGQDDGNEPPRCPHRDELVLAYPPDYVREGGSLSFSFERLNRRVDSVHVRYPTRRGAREEEFFFNPRQFNVRVIREAPGKPRRFDLVFRWLQNVGRTDACVGVDAYRNIPIAPRNARVGDADAPRFGGRYRARYSESKNARWRLRPRCDYFGCKTKLRSRQGLKANFFPRSGKRYKLFSREYAGSCTATFANGNQRTYSMYWDHRIRLRVTRQRARDGVARRLRGSRTMERHAPRDALSLCDNYYRYNRERVTVVRRRG